MNTEEKIEFLKIFYKDTKPTYKKCSEHFLKALEFYSNYNPNNKISMIGIDVLPDYNGLLLAINLKFMNKSAQNEIDQWDENTIASIDISNDKRILEYLKNKYSQNNEIKEYLRGVVNDTAEELAYEITKGNYNCDSQVLVGFNFYDEGFKKVKTVKFHKHFEVDSGYVDKEINRILKDEKSVAKEILLSLSFKSSPKRIVEDLEKMYYRDCNIPLYCSLTKCYDFYEMKDSFERLIKYTLSNTYIGRQILHDNNTLNFMIKNKINSKDIINCLKLEFEACKFEYLGQTLKALTGEEKLL